METVLKRSCLVLALCCLFTIDGSKQYHSKDDSTTTTTSSPSEMLEKNIVNLKILNVLQPDYFKYSVTLTYVPNQYLIRYLEEAVDVNSHFKFTATYFPNLGYSIDAINDLAGKWDPDHTYWQILNSSTPINLGVSSYQPTNGESITFNFTNSY